MSEYRGAELIRIGKIPLMDIVEDVVDELGWLVMERGKGWLSVKEKDRFDYYNPLRMRIVLSSAEEGRMKIEVNAENSGAGPVQDEYIRSQVNRFIDSVRMTAEGSGPASVEKDDDRKGQRSLSEELNRLAELYDDGKLTEEEYRKAKKQVLKG
ncbi:MAG: SHOCT domain-containing protein [Thermoplasmatota archaeon]